MRGFKYILTSFMNTLLQFRNYKKSYDYGSKIVLGIPELTLNRGIYWLKGPNGSGKTSLFKSIAGLIPFDGDIIVDGINIRKQRMAYRKIVNWAEAEPVYPDFLTGNELVAFYQATKGGSTNHIKELIGVIGIEKYLHQKVGSYSSGMVKKLSLLLAFIGEPKLILLDEPLITLDAQTVSIIQKMIQQYYQTGVSFLISSHQHFEESADLKPVILTIHDQTIS
jgi:ABC-2 type transport system ATP-binding protein